LRSTTIIARSIGLLALLVGLSVSAWAQPANDDPCNATALTVGTTCVFTQYTNLAATPSASVANPTCGFYTGGDVWFTAVVPANGFLVLDAQGGDVLDGAMSLYTGNNCNNLTQVACDDDGSATPLMPSISQTGLAPGSTVWIRFWSANGTAAGTFSLCARQGVPCNQQPNNSSCATSEPFCTGVSTDYCNTTGVPSLGSGGIYGCLGSTPNPAFYSLNISSPGTINFTISQQSPAGVGLDVDYAIWGPFANQADMCAGLSATNIVSCSFSGAAIENATIANALTGQWYMVLITNFSGQTGVINFNQTNTGQAGAATTNCNIVTALPGPCVGGRYAVSGTVTVPVPPSTGTCTITNSCGGTPVVLNAPFPTVINYSIPNLCGNGQLCTVSASFSDQPTANIIPATYIAPQCNSITAIPSACNNGTYTLNGVITNACAPASGTVTITSSCGGTVTLPASTAATNYSIPNLCGTGAACTVTATYSVAGSPNLTANFTSLTCNLLTAVPSACNAATGNYSVSGVLTHCPPASGNVTITSSCGGSLTVSSPIPASIPYTFNDICANGANCTISVTYSGAGAPVVAPVNYTAPTCAANTFTAVAGTCAQGIYALTGTVSGSCFPTTGTLTIATSCGTQQVFNAPFANPINYTFSNLDGNGLNCTVTATFSAAGAPVFTPINYTAPYCCESTTLNLSCATADAFCAGNNYNYCNTINQPSLGSAGIYGCLGSTPNPAFYYMNVANTGPIDITITQENAAGTPLDVDFVIWGPFASQSVMCTGLTAANIVDCSYSAAATEIVNIPNATSGQWYMLLITNYSNQPGVVNFAQTAGTGTTNCNLITVAPGACVNGKYTLNGTVLLSTPPASGTVTVTNTCGGSQVFSAPFASILNFSFPNLCGNGQSCTVSATMSNPGNIPAIVAATYTAPNCNSMTAVTTACSNGLYNLSGTVNVACPPATGSLTITSSCGGSVVLNAPFASPINYAINGLNATGNACNLTAVFSADASLVIPPASFISPFCCGANLPVTVSPTTATVCPTGAGATLTATGPASGGNIVTNSTVNNVAIPDAGLSGEPAPGAGVTGYISSQLTVAGVCPNIIAASTFIDVTVNITHTWDSDLVLWLRSPSGANLLLSSSNGGSANDYTNTHFVTTAITNITAGTVPFTNNFLPEGGFGALNGSPINGAWTLFVGDDAGGDLGTLVNWSIAFQAPTVNYTWAPAAGLSSTTTASTVATPATTTTYTVTATNSCGCSGTASSTITVQAPTSNLTSPVGPNYYVCAGSGNQLNFTGTAGATLNYTLNGVNGSAAIGAAGTANITPTALSLGATWPANTTLVFTSVSTGSGANVCSTPINFPITVRPAPAVIAFNVPTTLCTGSTATINIEATPNTVVSFTVNGVAQSVNIGATGVGSYTTAPLSANTTVNFTSIVYTTAPLCTPTPFTSNNTITVTNSVAPSFGAIGPFCFGEPATALPASSSNGIAGAWSPALINTTTVGVTNYTFTPTSTGCGATPVVVPITVFERPLVYAHGTNPTCSTLCNGNAVADVTGGTSPYTYAWSNGGVTATIASLCEGTYNVTVTDANGCQSQAFTPVSGCFQIQSILVDACIDGASEGLNELVFFQTGSNPINVSGATATWPNNSTTNLTCTNPTFISTVNATITGGGTLLSIPSDGIIPPNSNVVVVTSNTYNTSLNSFASLSVPTYVIFNCSSTPTGWFLNTTNISNPRTLTLNLGAGCSDAVTYNSLNLVNTSGVQSSGGGNATTNSGAYVNFSQSGTPSYLNYGCVVPFAVQDNSVFLDAPDPVTPTFNAVGPYCSGSAVPALPTVSTNTPTTFTGTWTPAINNTTTTTYTFTPSPATQCATTAQLTITIDPLPTVNAGANQAVCAGGVVNLNGLIGGSATSATWSAPTGTFANANALSTTYTPTITSGTVILTLTTNDPAGPCTPAFANITVTVNPLPIATISPAGPVTICQGGSVTLISGVADQYLWNYGPVTQTVNVNAAGSYSVTVTNPQGCSATSAPVIVNLVNLPTATISGNATVCAGATAQIVFSGTPGATITYNGGAGNQTVVLDANGQGSVNTPPINSTTTFNLVSASIGSNPVCSQPLSGSAIITVPPAPTMTISGTSTICYDGIANITFNGTPNSTALFTVNGGPSQAVVLNNAGTAIVPTGQLTANATYTLTGVQSGTSPFCLAAASGSAVITVLPQLNATISGASTVCSGQTASIQVTGTPNATVTYQVNGGASSTIALNAAGTATLITPALNASATYSLISVSLTGPNACLTPLQGDVLIYVAPNNTVTAASASPTLCLGQALPTITHNTTGATGIGTATGLPAGVTATWVANVITIAGTPTATGTFNYSIPLTGGCGAVNATGTMVVNPLNTAGAPSANPTLCPNIALTPITISTTGATGIGAATGLPAGVTASWSANVITISGTPSAPGVYSYTIPLIGGCGNVNATGTITISDVLDFVNLQFPASATICATGSFNAFGQLYNTGAINTEPAGAAPGVTVQIGYSASNNDPATWTNWVNASFNTQVGNNDEYTGTLSGLAAGTYYYAFRYQINGCAWQYGGYSASGGGFWNGTNNVSGLLTVNAAPLAGNDGALTVCATGASVNLFTSLGTSASSTGTWSGPSALLGGNLGTFNPAVNSAGVYTYTVSVVGCPDDQAVVNVTVGTAPTASVVYPTPICTNEAGSIVPTILGTTGGTFSSAPAGLNIQLASGAINAAASTVGNYAVTYLIAAANGCSAFQTVANVSIVAAPAIPTLNPNPACSNTSTFTAGGGTWYEFFVNGTSQGPASATNTLNSAAGFAAGTQVCVRSYPLPPIMDGALTDASWGSEIAGSTGGALSSFGANRIDGLKLLNRNGILYGAVAGTEEDGTAEALNNRIALFIDCRAGGFNSLSAWTNRSAAASNTSGLTNLNNGIVFDAGFEADYILSMNRFNGQTFFDLYDMAANTNNFLGSGPSAQFGFQANASEGDLTKGFEFSLPLTALGNPGGVLKVFGMLINDPGAAATTISNQFITPANTGEGSYGSNAVFFNNAAPNPVLYQVTQDCFEETCVTVQQSVTPLFNPIAPLCSGSAAPTLPLNSTNGVGGTWSPAVVSNTTTTTYTFTPTGGGCATTASLTVEITPQVTPVFDTPAPVCFGTTAPVLSTTSNNGIVGTWTGPVSNTATGSYTFTPNGGQCASSSVLTVSVLPEVILDGIFHD
jgi:subtilisin-like proprotein convertase family protein